MTSRIRMATADDAEQIRDIYAPYCDLTCAVSFEIVAPSIDEMRRRITDTVVSYPWLVMECDGQILGYAYSGAHKQRAAYRWCVEVSVYIARSAQGQGVGKSLYTELFHLLRKQGFINVYAGIALPNPASSALHQSMGFTPVGVYKQVGFKNGAWHDVVWLELQLQERCDRPGEPLSIDTAYAEMERKRHN